MTHWYKRYALECFLGLFVEDRKKLYILKHGEEFTSYVIQTYFEKVILHNLRQYGQNH